jgi:hypothetical protein
MSYNNNINEFLSKLLEAWDKNSVSYTFMQSMFHNFVNDSPSETLNTLFLKSIYSILYCLILHNCAHL